MADQPHPVDVHVGSRVRLSRTLAGLSQQKLAGLLGITFQQVQKYEKGTNRISSSKLWQICQILELSPGYLFEGAEHVTGDASAVPVSDTADGENMDVGSLFRREILELVRAYDRIDNQTIRRHIRDLVKSLGSSNI